MFDWIKGMALKTHMHTLFKFKYLPIQLFVTRHGKILTVNLSKSGMVYLVILLLMQAGLQPSNDSCSKFPCVVCSSPCRWDQRAIQCDECDKWYHTSCMGINTINYEVMGNANISRICCNCGVPNCSTSLFSQWSLETSNSFSSLSNLSNVSVGDDLPSPPVAASSPKNISSKSRKPKNQTNKPMPRKQLN